MAAGLSNPEIGGQLFLNAGTVAWHLRKVFAELGIRSRRQLRVALPEGGRPLRAPSADPAPTMAFPGRISTLEQPYPNVADTSVRRGGLLMP